MYDWKEAFPTDLGDTADDPIMLDVDDDASLPNQDPVNSEPNSTPQSNTRATVPPPPSPTNRPRSTPNTTYP